jgi:hypothetical protein
MADYNDSVFINCPFDDGYTPLLRAIVFTIYRCGFFPVTALAEDDASDNRLSKIERCIGGCRYGVHDISRIELGSNNLPRFNMPFELGIFFGAKRFGDKFQKNKVALIFDSHRYRYQQYISDLNGVDIKAHENNVETVIRNIRNWLQTSSRRKTIPGHLNIIKEYADFTNTLPDVVNQLGLDISNLLFLDYCVMVEEAIDRLLKSK